MWELDHKESWAPKNWCFWTVVLEKTLESPLDCKEIQQGDPSILKEISPGCSLEGLMLKLKLQYFGHLMWRADSFEKTLMLKRLRAGGEGDDRGWGGWMASPTNQLDGHGFGWLSDWTELNWCTSAEQVTESFQWHQWCIFLKNWEFIMLLATKPMVKKSFPSKW